MRSVEIFSGAGGLAMGLSKAGIHHDLLVEWNKSSVNTLLLNQDLRSEMREWEIRNADVRTIDFRKYHGQVSIVAGGPPCQPFSLGGKHRGCEDERDMFPEAVRAVREIAPQAFLFENVKGLARPSFRPYFNYICHSLQQPALVKGKEENWEAHHRRLLDARRSSFQSDLSYHLAWQVVNAADYGIPQTRERVILIGIRSDLEILPSFPAATHSEFGLLQDQYLTMEYWKRCGLEVPGFVGACSEEFRRNLAKKAERMGTPRLSPWKTVREALDGLPNPQMGVSSFQNHIFRPGARSYPGHCGSGIDEPSKTIKAGAHGVPGGENMIRDHSGAVRYFTVRESARIQTFPDDYLFQGTWTESMRQIGNAVPVELAFVLGKHILNLLSRNTEQDGEQRRVSAPETV